MVPERKFLPIEFQLIIKSRRNNEIRQSPFSTPIEIVLGKDHQSLPKQLDKTHGKLHVDLSVSHHQSYSSSLTHKV